MHRKELIKRITECEMYFEDHDEDNVPDEVIKEMLGCERVSKSEYSDLKFMVAVYDGFVLVRVPYTLQLDEDAYDLIYIYIGTHRARWYYRSK